MVARIALAFLIIAIPLFVGACAGRSQTAQQPEAHTPIWRSQLRERALLLLAEAARDENALVRANALEGLAPVPMRARPFVFDALTDRNLGVRYAGAMLAGRLALPDAAPLLRDLQSDADASVRAASIYALSALRQPVDPGPLATMLLDGDVRTRAQAAFILGEMGNRSAVPLLREALMRPAPNARLSDVRLLNLQIAEALAKLGDADAFEAIRAALYPSRPEELEAAALAVQIIGEVGDRRSIDQLIYMAERGETEEEVLPAEIRLAAAASLAQLGLPRGDFIADEYAADEMPAIRAQAAYVYGQVGSDRALERLEGMLDDPSPIVAVSAAAAIVTALSDGFR